MISDLNPIKWDDCLYLIDQRILPHTENWVKVTSLEQTFEAISTMVVRGAPCIGASAIFGMALWAKSQDTVSPENIKKAAEYLITARPTAVNLKYEVDRCVDLFSKENLVNGKMLFERLVQFGLKSLSESYEKNKSMAEFATIELEKKYGDKKLRIMTHCNTGYLACGVLGTALGVISHLAELGRIENVWASETRPYMQGSRLTAYELVKQNIPHKVVVEGASSYLMRENLVDAIFVGADRVAMNGDTANKIGTSTLSIVANHYNIPFYVVAPLSSFDSSIKDGKEIAIEMRDSKEILTFKDYRVAPTETEALNPSFDITSGEMIEKVICEKGAFKASSQNLLTGLF